MRIKGGMLKHLWNRTRNHMSRFGQATGFLRQPPPNSFANPIVGNQPQIQNNTKKRKCTTQNKEILQQYKKWRTERNQIIQEQDKIRDAIMEQIYTLDKELYDITNINENSSSSNKKIYFKTIDNINHKMQYLWEKLGTIDKRVARYKKNTTNFQENYTHCTNNNYNVPYMPEQEYKRYNGIP